MISEKLWANILYFPNELSAEVRDFKSFNEQLQARDGGLDVILNRELQSKSALVQSRKLHLQVAAVCRGQRWLLVQLLLIYHHWSFSAAATQGGERQHV